MYGRNTGRVTSSRSVPFVDETPTLVPTTGLRYGGSKHKDFQLTSIRTQTPSVYSVLYNVYTTTSISAQHFWRRTTSPTPPVARSTTHQASSHFLCGRCHLLQLIHSAHPRRNNKSSSRKQARGRHQLARTSLSRSIYTAVTSKTSRSSAASELYYRNGTKCVPSTGGPFQR